MLLGADGAWKICDFGSTSTNHKCFDKPEEMGIEEDNIRKYTTPAYRAPEVLLKSFFSSKCIRRMFYKLLKKMLFNSFSYLMQMWDLFRREVLSEKVDIWVSNLNRNLSFS